MMPTARSTQDNQLDSLYPTANIQAVTNTAAKRAAAPPARFSMIVNLATIRPRYNKGPLPSSSRNVQAFRWPVSGTPASSG